MENQQRTLLSRFDFASPVRISFGEGLVEKVADYLGGTRKVLIVTGRRSAAESGLTKRIITALKGAEYKVFDRAEPNPSISTVEEGARTAIEFEADAVIGAGGGSAMDAAKAIAALAANRADFDSMQSGAGTSRPSVRTIMIPSTCGTGSESNRYAIITDTRKNDKINFSSPLTYPSVGLLDPTVMEGIPRQILVSTAFDAFTHAFEGFVSLRSQPFSDLIAKEAMPMILSNMVPAAEGERAAMGKLLYASCLAGIVIDHTGTTILHALGYYLTLRHGVPHGTANAALLPVLFAHMEEADRNKMKDAYSCFPDFFQTPDRARSFIKEMGIGVSLSDYGIGETELDDLIAYTLPKKNTAATRGPVTAERLRALLRKYAL